MKARVSILVLFLMLVLLSACSSQPAGQQKAAKAPKPTETQTGREAFQRLYVQSRGWAPDVKPVRLESANTSDADGRDGKAAVWRGYFASPSRSSLKPYLWSGSAAEGAPDRGVTPGTEDTWNPNNSSTKAFDIAFLKVDSDKAFGVAQEHGGDKLLKADPKQPVLYVLDWNSINNELVWHVIYGTNVNDAKLRVAVNASDGKFIRVEK